MSICQQTFDSAPEAIKYLESLAFDGGDYIFRGQPESRYILKTTYSRFTETPHLARDISVEELINRFRSGLAKHNLLPEIEGDRHTWFEYARHHGVPSPSLDFTYSPYVALFFAFNGLHGDFINKKEEVAVYALNITALAHGWASFVAPDKTRKGERYTAVFNAFRYPESPLFGGGFPTDTLQFMPYPSKMNQRMQRQQGAFLYDTLDYGKIGFKNLEDFIDGIDEFHSEGGGRSCEEGATLVKVGINKKCAKDVFQRLELMGINGGMLLSDADGIAMDVINSYRAAHEQPAGHFVSGGGVNPHPLPLSQRRERGAM